MTMTKSINPDTKAKLDALAAEIAVGEVKPEQTEAGLAVLEAKAEAAVELILVRDAEALERLADA